jgi:hypothetical protein
VAARLAIRGPNDIHVSIRDRELDVRMLCDEWHRMQQPRTYVPSLLDIIKLMVKLIGDRRSFCLMPRGRQVSRNGGVFVVPAPATQHASTGVYS